MDFFSELQYASHYNNNSNSSGVDISTEIINPTYNERHHQQQQQREQDLLQPEQGQQLQSVKKYNIYIIIRINFENV